MGSIPASGTKNSAKFTINMAKYNNKEKPITFDDLPSSQHSDPRTFISRLEINQIIFFNNQQNHFFQITEFENIIPEKTIVHGFCVRRIDGEIKILNKKIIPPNLTVKNFNGDYVGYSQYENNVTVIGTAGEDRFSMVPIARKNLNLN